MMSLLKTYTVFSKQKVMLYENKFDEYIAYVDIGVYSSNAPHHIYENDLPAINLTVSHRVHIR